MSEIERNYYCSQKFRYLKIDLESRSTYTCHAAQPHPVDFTWLQSNSGNLFNHEINVQERTMMLQNHRAPSCEQNCWKAEDQGSISPRMYQHGIERTHTEVVTLPETLDITVGSDCNLTCSYCTKEYSSAWRRDINNNGPYNISNYTDGRYRLSDFDKILLKISQPELAESSRYQQLLSEIQQISSKVKRIDITGGEPLLNNRFISMLSTLDLSSCDTVTVYTGLGVDSSRLLKMLDKLKSVPNLVFAISAETTEKLLEFNRYGVSWTQFQNNLNMIRAAGIALRFHSVITNLTILGFRQFYDKFFNDDITLTYAFQPNMMASYVLDEHTKQQLSTELSELPLAFSESLLKSIQATPTEQERLNIKEFLCEFVSRRPDLTLNIFPKTFLNWMEIDHVV
jgi:organic radical activating enzyme